MIPKQPCVQMDDQSTMVSLVHAVKNHVQFDDINSSEPHFVHV
ncbi:hypothetical protein RISK_003632 [Rhodopirellula islandica]|uniref:Uncharacterized protein n=1 Tax=Rhodopirellula islandica TaxID=595434 RepID=A0A0J1BDA4_RHOIS|nr:hypothetical protein RISK_003632 [Rhodopirellula islandica]